ncbi:ribonuclease Z [Peptostreptococcus faecalis]|uniref:ribonuclease Z n=1 Tax=Peptostreptococcus faecalis TaxID=2045015 RepID=UPI000C7E4F75|nr:ribonuclease Z [Peptostreptococcus faecalis]
MVNITMIGTGGNVPSHKRFCSSMFINYKGKKILIDCGEGTQVSMKTLGCGFKDIDLILITHLHGDHINGLLGLLSTMGNAEKRNILTIVGPVGIKKAISAMMVLWEGLPYRLRIIENPGGPFSIDEEIFNEIEISTIALKHSTECLGYSLYFKRNRSFDVNKALENSVPKYLWKNLQSGKTFYIDDIKYDPEMVLGSSRKGIKVSFITDTRPISSIPDFIRESDLFVCEAMYGDEADISKAVKNKHMLFREAATLAKNGNVKKLLLTHFSPSIEKPEDFIDNAKNIFANTTVAYDGIRISIPYPED